MMMRGLLPPGVTRDQFKASMATLPALDPSDVQTAIDNADLIRDDYASAALQIVDATAAGKKAKLVRIGLGAAGGLILGVIVGKLV